MFALHSQTDELLGSEKAGAILKKGQQQPGKEGSLSSNNRSCLCSADCKGKHRGTTASCNCTQLVTSTWNGRSTVPELACEIRWNSVFPCYVINSNSNCFCRRRSCGCNLRLAACKDCPWPMNATSVFVTLPIGGLTDLLSRRTKNKLPVECSVEKCL